MLEALYACVAGLAGAIAVMWRTMERHHDDCVKDRRQLWEKISPTDRP